MKSSKLTPRRGTPYDERAVALAKRLGIEIPLNPLMLWVEIGKALLPTEPPKPVTLNQLWADIGMYLAELREPEFQWGPGRRPGSKNKRLAPAVTKEAQRKRRQREKAQREKN